MSGHVYLGNDGHTALGSVGLYLPALLLRVVLAGIARGMGCIGELRKGFDLEPPRQFFGQMPVKDIHLEPGQSVYLVLQFVDGQEGAPHIVHESPNLKGGPVGEGQRLDGGCAPVALGQLLQGLCSTDDTRGGDSLDTDGVGADAEPVSLVGEECHSMVYGTGNGGHQPHPDHWPGLRVSLATRLGEHAQQIGAVGGVVYM